MDNEQETADKDGGFREELEELINRYSKETKSSTPDFVLADYLINCLNAYDRAVEWRDRLAKPTGE